MVTTLYLIRHGETEGAETKRYKGTIDVPLSQKGIRQIEHLSRHLVSNTMVEMSAVYTSDLGRAVKSAEIIAGPWSLRPVSLSSFRERNFGLWEGMSFDEIREQYPEQFSSWADNPIKFSPLGGESTIEVRNRVIPAFLNIREQHQGKSFAIVSHGGVNRVILCEILGIPLEHIFRVEQDYGCLNTVEFWDAYPVVKLLNGVFGG